LLARVLGLAAAERKPGEGHHNLHHSEHEAGGAGGRDDATLEFEGLKAATPLPQRQRYCIAAFGSVMM
jgi:hypothetical protein